jgi:hypothetical protein
VSRYGTLTADHRTVVREKVVEGDRSPDDWLALLAPLAVFDAETDKARRRAGGWLAAVIIIGIILTIVGLAVAPIAGAAIGVATIVLGVVLWSVYRQTKKMDLANGPLAFAVPLMPILREDVDPEEPVHLRLDLAGYRAHGKDKGKSEPYKRGAYHKIVDTFYEDPWLAGHARFVDGTDLQFNVTDVVISQRKTKRNPRGKVKTKTKIKKKTTIQLVAGFPAKNYKQGEAKAAAPEGMRKEKVQPGEARTTVRLASVAKLAGGDAAADPRMLIDLVARAYQQIAPARRKKL